MNKKYHMREKAFLGVNPDERDYVVAVVEDARERNVSRFDPNECSEISLHIGDWRHEVELLFYIDTAEERENSLHKIRTLTEMINLFRQALESEIEVINARESITRHTRVSSAVH
jgi:hypothetical protein